MVFSQSMKRRKKCVYNDFTGDYFIKNKKKYVMEDEDGVFVPYKRHIQAFSYTLLPTTLVDNIYLLVHDVVNQMLPAQVRSSRNV